MLYFDESGYTGPDLTNLEQPYFTLASIRLTDVEAAVMKKEIRYEEWGKEFHFLGMYKNPQGRHMLNRVFNYPFMDIHHVMPSYAYKRYCIYANIVNMLVETRYYHNGINLYQGAKNLILANGLYYFAELHPNKELIAEFESHFVKMVREPSDESIENFYRTTDKLRYNKETMDGFFDMLSELPPTIIYIKEALSDQKFYIDLTVPLFSFSIQEWYKKTGVKDDVLFDSSEPFFANKDFLESLRDMRVPETAVGYGVGNGKHVYPLPIGKMELAKSHNEFGIQLADIYASALNFALTPRADKYVKYQNELKKLPIFQNILNLAPSTNEYIQQRMKETADIDPLDFLCDHEDDINHKM
ncbi:DUF3800 domain-containing protein [Segatella paludivivens]|uniref:DUF3800 domain-containing protein n=1 Tax=Segatella paludivivens TaxID=185294 RepID=UPI0003730A2A|nr:DUF3800 domain-containing protein [Segatella paludivivens]